MAAGCSSDSWRNRLTSSPQASLASRSCTSGGSWKWLASPGRTFLAMPDRPQAHGQRDLRRLVDDAVVKGALREDGVRDAEARRRHHWRAEPRALHLLRGVPLLGREHGELAHLRVDLGKDADAQHVETRAAQLQQDVVPRALCVYDASRIVLFISTRHLMICEIVVVLPVPGMPRTRA